jgi:hypothetical protein
VPATIALLLGSATGPLLARSRWPLRLPGVAIALSITVPVVVRAAWADAIPLLC